MNNILQSYSPIQGQFMVLCHQGTQWEFMANQGKGPFLPSTAEFFGLKFIDQSLMTLVFLSIHPLMNGWSLSSSTCSYANNNNKTTDPSIASFNHMVHLWIRGLTSNKWTHRISLHKPAHVGLPSIGSIPGCSNACKWLHKSGIWPCCWAGADIIHLLHCWFWPRAESSDRNRVWHLRCWYMWSYTLDNNWDWKGSGE